MNRLVDMETKQMIDRLMERTNDIELAAYVFGLRELQLFGRGMSTPGNLIVMLAPWRLPIGGRWLTQAERAAFALSDWRCRYCLGFGDYARPGHLVCRTCEGLGKIAARAAAERPRRKAA